MTQHDMNEPNRLDDEQLAAQERRVWTVSEAARLLGISRAHAYELVARRELPHLRLGRRIVIPRQALDELLDAT